MAFSVGGSGSGEVGMKNARDMTFLKDADLDKAVGLVFELAAQLHVEATTSSSAGEIDV